MKIVNINDLASEIRARADGYDKPFLVALDGLSGSGKTTLSVELGKDLEASVISGDDFYSGGQLEEWADRTPKEKAEGAMDWQRMRSEALEPLLKGKVAMWRTFNWSTGVGLSDDKVICRPTHIIILDGAFSTRPELSDLVDLAVIVKVPDGIRRKRLRDREGKDFMEKWHQVWDEGEAYYYSQVRPDSSFDILIITG